MPSVVIRAVDRLALVRSEQLGLGTRRSKGSPTPDGSARGFERVVRQAQLDSFSDCLQP